MLLTHRKLLQSKAIAIENDLRGTLRNFGLKRTSELTFSTTKATLFSLLCVQNRTCGIAKAGHNGPMAETLTTEEFASLLAVGNTGVNGPAPAIPAEHAALLMTLGYMVDLEGRLRMTTAGRIRIYAGQLAS